MWNLINYFYASTTQKVEEKLRFKGSYKSIEISKTTFNITSVVAFTKNMQKHIDVKPQGFYFLKLLSDVDYLKGKKTKFCVCVRMDHIGEMWSTVDIWLSINKWKDMGSVIILIFLCFIDLIMPEKQKIMIWTDIVWTIFFIRRFPKGFPIMYCACTKEIFRK